MTETSISAMWRSRIDSGVFRKGLCRQWCLAVVPLSQGYAPKGAKTNLTIGEAGGLRRLILERGGVRLEPSHEQQGIDWLRRHGAKALGAEIAPYIERFDHFEFHGEAVMDVDPQGWVSRSLPRWRFVTTDGAVIRYHNQAWQEPAYTTGDAWRAWEVLS